MLWRKKEQLIADNKFSKCQKKYHQIVQTTVYVTPKSKAKHIDLKREIIIRTYSFDKLDEGCEIWCVNSPERET